MPGTTSQGMVQGSENLHFHVGGGSGGNGSGSGGGGDGWNIPDSPNIPPPGSRALF